VKAAVIVFPASNCERDAYSALHSAFSGSWGEEIQGEVVRVWHQETKLPKVDLVILPGGFSYGDYLRCGAMAARSNIMQAVMAHAAAGGYVIGICNGFQILTESGLLQGALMRNRDLKFICKNATLKVENNKTPFTNKYESAQVLNFPVAHHDGCFYADDDTVKSLNDNSQIAFRYTNIDGIVNDEANINGSLQNIAGILNKNGNVLGLMPHPERVCDSLTGGVEGRGVFNSLMAKVA
jgi:phosphoribosylformylglycinamidine synthase subunit PurQ / glutaminase